jgi:hypothetical protein
MSEEWKNGYKQGFQDGMEIGKLWRDRPDPSQYQLPTDYGELKCKVCGMSFTDGLGRIKTMGYVCPHNNCPGIITCNTGQMTTMQPYNSSWSSSMAASLIKDPGPSDGMSYEEIYGSVIYQQNNKKEE